MGHPVRIGERVHQMSRVGERCHPVDISTRGIGQSSADSAVDEHVDQGGRETANQPGGSQTSGSFFYPAVIDHNGVKPPFF